MMAATLIDASSIGYAIIIILMEAEFIIKFVDHKIDGKTVFYTVQVYEKKTGQSWNFQARFSQLLEIHQACETHLPKGELPDFPPKKMFGNTNPEFVVRRKKELQNYYSTLLKSIALDKLPELRKLIQSTRPKPQPKKAVEPVLAPSPVIPNTESQQALLKKKFDEISEDTVKKFIDISNEYFDPPDEGMIKRKKILFDKVKYDVRSKLLPGLVLPKGTADNFGDFWAVNYFEDHEEFVSLAREQLAKIKIEEILNEANLEEKVIKTIG